MEQRLPGSTNPRSPVVYARDNYLYLIAGQDYWPTYWVASHRDEMSGVIVAQFVNDLQIDTVHDILDRYSQTPPSGNHNYDPLSLRRELIQLIQLKKIKVYKLSRLHYTSTLMDINNHLTSDLNIIDRVTHRSEENLLHKQLELSQELSTILSVRWEHKIRMDDQFWAQAWYNRLLVVTGGALNSIGEGIAGLVKLGAVVIEGVYDASAYQLKLLGQLSQGEFEQVGRELVKLGIDTVNEVEDLQQQIQQGYEILEPLLEDEKSRKLLMDFLSGYVDSVPYVEKGAFAVSIPLEVLIALATMGAGAAITASNAARRVGQFSTRALELIIELSRALKRFRQKPRFEAPASGKKSRGKVTGTNDTITSQKSVRKSNTDKTISASSPAEIYHGFGSLSKRQQDLLDQLPDSLSNVKLNKSNVNVTDLAALTAQTGDEFALFTRGSQRMIVRGNQYGVPLTRSELAELQRQGFKFSGHTHPGTSDITLNASGTPGDREVLRIFNQQQSLILNSSGRRSVYDAATDRRVP